MRVKRSVKNIKSRLGIVVILIALFIGSCSDNSVSPELEALVGSYEMTRIDNRTIPFVMDSTQMVPPEKADSCETFYQGGWLILKSNGEYEMEFDVRATLCEGTEDKATSRRLNYGNYEYNLDEGVIELLPNNELPFDEDRFEGDLRNTGLNTEIWVDIDGKSYVFETMRVRR